VSAVYLNYEIGLLILADFYFHNFTDRVVIRLGSVWERVGVIYG
jgi:hypothetical protein